MDLIRTAYNYNLVGQEVVILKSCLDTRDIGVVRTRIGPERSCIQFKEEDNLYNMVSVISSEKEIACVLVDEVQFMRKEQAKQLWEIVIDLDIPVVAYGLRIDYRGEGFEASKELMTLVHTIEEIKTICKCGRKATHHLLKVDREYIFKGDGVFVGGTEYSAVCGHC